MPTQARIQKVETAVAVLATDFSSLKTDVQAIAAQQTAFVSEWRSRNEAEAERALNQVSATRLTMPQIVGMIGTAVSVTAIFLAAAMWLIRSDTAAVEQRLSGRIEAEAAKTTLTMSRAQEAATAANAQLATLARDFATASVRLGLVDQTASRTARQLEALEHIDAEYARLDERMRSMQDRMK